MRRIIIDRTRPFAGFPVSSRRVFVSMLDREWFPIQFINEAGDKLTFHDFGPLIGSLNLTKFLNAKPRQLMLRAAHRACDGDGVLLEFEQFRTATCYGGGSPLIDFARWLRIVQPSVD